MTTPRDTDCVFCRIIARDLPAAVVYEDDRVIAFLDAFPSSEGHTLVVPKAHHRDILDTPVEDLQAVAVVAKRVALAQRKALKPDGHGVAQFNGKAAGQTVFHYHMHVVPRWEGQNMNIHGRTQAPIEQLQAVAAKIREAFE